MIITKETAHFEEKIGEILKKGNVFKLEYCGKDGNIDLYGAQYSVEVVGDDVDTVESFKVTALNAKAEEQLELVADTTDYSELVADIENGAVIIIGEDKVKEI